MQQPINVTLDNGCSLWFEYFRGVVVEESKRSETEIGSDNIVRHTLNGSYAQTVITSEQIRTHSIWLRNAEGLEREVELPSHGFSVRHGHDVTVAWGGAQGQQQGAYVLAINRTTGSTWRLSLAGNNERWLRKAFGIQTPSWPFWMRWIKWTLILSFATGLICSVIFQSIASFATPIVIMLCGPGEIIAFFVAVGIGVKEQDRVTARIEKSFVDLADRLQRDDVGGAVPGAHVHNQLPR